MDAGWLFEGGQGAKKNWKGRAKRGTITGVKEEYKKRKTKDWVNGIHKERRIVSILYF